jgi:hypothetical protein
MKHWSTIVRLCLVIVFLSAWAGWGRAVQAANLDGMVSPNEYPHSASFVGGDYQVYWQIQGDIITLAMKCKTTGWVALGLSPSIKMKDADMLIGWVTRDGQVQMVDAYSLSETGANHPADHQMGGTDDILAKAGSLQGGWTTLEFQRKLETGDSYDKPIPASGPLSIIWSWGANENWSDLHLSRGKATIDMGGQAPAQERSIPLLWPYHAALMGIGILLSAMTIWLVLFGRKRKGWLVRHRSIGLAGGVALLLGLALGIVMVQLSTGIHLRVVHTWVGLAALLFTLAVLLLGIRWFQLRQPAQKKPLRPWHLWLARVDALFLVATVVLGFIAAGVL